MRLHTVNPNETRLAQITDWYQLDLNAVAALNSLAVDAPLTAGTALCLQAVGQSAPVPPAASQPQAEGIPDPCTRWHIVANEKSLAQIAGKFGLDLNTVVTINQWLNPNTLLWPNAEICLARGSSPAPSCPKTFLARNRLWARIWLTPLSGPDRAGGLHCLLPPKPEAAPSHDRPGPPPEAVPLRPDRSCPQGCGNPHPHPFQGLAGGPN